MNTSRGQRLTLPSSRPRWSNSPNPPRPAAPGRRSIGAPRWHRSEGNRSSRHDRGLPGIRPSNAARRWTHAATGSRVPARTMQVVDVLRDVRQRSCRCVHAASTRWAAFGARRNLSRRHAYHSTPCAGRARMPLALPTASPVKLRHNPPADLNVGTPLAADTPAPVSTVTLAPRADPRREVQSPSRSFRVRGGAASRSLTNRKTRRCGRQSETVAQAENCRR